MSKKNHWKCSVSGCPSPQDATYFKFPKTDSIMTEKWLNACRRQDVINVEKSKVCSEHFTTSDFERDVRHELLNLPPRKLLKPSAVPTQGLLPEVPDDYGNEEQASAVDQQSPPQIKVNTAVPSLKRKVKVTHKGQSIILYLLVYH